MKRRKFYASLPNNKSNINRIVLRMRSGRPKHILRELLSEAYRGFDWLLSAGYKCGCGTGKDAANKCGITSYIYDLDMGFDLLNCEIPENSEFAFGHPHDRQFIRTTRGIIPMILSGSNNCTEFIWDARGRTHERRERRWWAWVPGNLLTMDHSEKEYAVIPLLPNRECRI